MKKRQELKLKLKSLAVEIRKLKSTRKQCKSGYVPGLEAARERFRINHIAYCLLRGRTMDKIERGRSLESMNNFYTRRIEEIMDEYKKMYVLVRKDLPGTQPAVQAGHALAEYLIEYPKCGWTNGTLIYLGVENEEELLDRVQQIIDRGIKFSIFEEPDLNMQVTAFAAFDCPDKKLEKLFKNLNLL